MKIVVFQLHVRGWVDGGHQTRARQSPKCRVVPEKSAQKSNI